jgi:small multidrug resistance pump
MALTPNRDGLVFCNMTAPWRPVPSFPATKFETTDKVMTQTQIGLFYLAIAIVTEVIATSALKASAQFTRLWPSVIVAMGYATSFYLLSRVLKVIPVGVTYAIWSGMGIVLISLVGAILYGEIPDAPAVIGMTLIVIGVVVINVWSGTLSR